jgi:hypothetical protein
MVKCPYPNCKGNLELKKGKKRTYVCTTSDKHIVDRKTFRILEKDEMDEMEARSYKRKAETEQAAKKDREGLESEEED